MDVLTSRPPGRFPIADVGRARVRRAPVLRDGTGAVRGYLPYASFDIPLAFRLLLVRRPDVVIVEPPPTTGVVVRALCALRGIPYVYYAGDIVADAARSAGSPEIVLRIVRWLERASWRGAEAVLSVSSEVTERLITLEVPSNQIVEVGNGVDTELFTVDGPVREVAAPFALYAGTASEVHGAGVFIEALSQVKDMRLVFIGAGAEWSSLRRLAERVAPGRVEFHDTVAPTEIASWMRASRVALGSVLPTGGYGFAFPTKMYAAVSTGTPVLYAGEGPGRRFAETAPHSESVDHDPVAVAAALARFRDSHRTEDQRSELGRWARRFVSIEAAAARAADAAMSAVDRISRTSRAR